MAAVAMALLTQVAAHMMDSLALAAFMAHPTAIQALAEIQGEGAIILLHRLLHRTIRPHPLLLRTIHRHPHLTIHLLQSQRRHQCLVMMVFLALVVFTELLTAIHIQLLLHFLVEIMEVIMEAIIQVQVQRHSQVEIMVLVTIMEATTQLQGVMTGFLVLAECMARHTVTQWATLMAQATRTDMMVMATL
jgi:hypothetical protein